MADYLELPADLPVPEDDRAAEHLPGRAMPQLTLGTTDAGTVTVLYLYPMTGRPGVALPEGWDEIPGARGCTPESCGFRDHHAELREAGAQAVYGLSSQSTEYQREAARRLALPFALVSDPGLALGQALALPTFVVDGERLYRRLTMIVTDGVIEHVFYPVFPPDLHASQVLAWLRAVR
jgi:peroxiredoxin